MKQYFYLIDIKSEEFVCRIYVSETKVFYGARTFSDFETASNWGWSYCEEFDEEIGEHFKDIKNFDEIGK